MTPFADYIQQGAAHAWLFIPSAILLGALHGLEPGHSKTMMAAFIVAVRGTVTQAVLLGLAATFSHTLVVWIIALLGLHFGRQWNAEMSEPYFLMGSAVLIIGIAVWMAARTWRDHQREKEHDHRHSHHRDERDLGAETLNYQNAHELAHARDIRRRFANRHVTTGQIILFGLTGGLLPCPAAITVLIVCLQLKEFTLGVALVLCFSIGLAATMVASGTLAALSVRHLSGRWSGFGALARRAPYLSSALIICIGIYTGIQGWLALGHAHP
ncbi:MAG: nickel/cobalt efflux transporter [Bdellovibrionales bacterium]